MKETTQSPPIKIDPALIRKLAELELRISKGAYTHSDVAYLFDLVLKLLEASDR